MHSASAVLVALIAGTAKAMPVDTAKRSTLTKRESKFPSYAWGVILAVLLLFVLVTILFLIQRYWRSKQLGLDKKRRFADSTSAGLPHSYPPGRQSGVSEALPPYEGNVVPPQKAALYGRA